MSATDDTPFYKPHGNEMEVFEYAYRHRLPLLIKGPTGCGKTRFVAHMAAQLGRPLYTVACHDDLTAADLVGRHLIGDGETYWNDGPLTRAVREGAICYLDEVVEARKDTTVVIHPLADDRRILPQEKRGILLESHPDVHLVISYNPGYQSITKDLKHSTKQRFASMVFDHPPVDVEARIIHTESALPNEESRKLAEMGTKLRDLKGFGVEEGVSSRLLVYVGRLMKEGLSACEACKCAISQTLTDETDVMESINDIVNLYFGSFDESEADDSS